MVTVIANPPEVEYLDTLLLDGANGRIKLLPASVYSGIDPVHLAIWSGRHAMYAFPTTELVDWLRTLIGERKAIEIGAGNGDLGYHLGIPMVDNYCQQIPEVRSLYEAMRQAPTSPRSDVEKIDAVVAVKKYRPQVVIGAYITQKYKGGNNGNVYGPEEEEILEGTRCYVHIGNEKTHGDKRIRRHRHQTLRFDWLVTRSMQPESNVIYVWGK